jgi:hypothetical protein
MKIIYLSILSTLLVVAVSCRKKTALDLPDQSEEVSYTCLNGVMDGNEDGIDCGPDCGPCNLSVADCFGIVENQFTASSTTTNFSAGQVTSSTATGVLVVTGTNGSKMVRATFGSADPTVFASYDVIQWGTPGPNEVKLEYNNGTYLYTGYTDIVHLNRINGKYSIEFCDVYMSTPSVGGYIIGQGKLTVN